jgi:poly-gamma-glutamate capsule biosynthesis protein CapA/YwtB (metallophosphatase superfamily)
MKRITKSVHAHRITAFRSLSYFIKVCLIILCAMLAGCNRAGQNSSPDPADSAQKITQAVSPSPLPSVTPPEASPSAKPQPEPSEAASYIDEAGNDLESRIRPPEGFARIPSSEGELTRFLRTLPLKSAGSDLLLYNGQAKGNQNGHAAIFQLSLSDRDLQQCADSIIRIYAEYYWSIGEYDKIAFHLTNGFYMEYTKWREGYRIQVNGNEVSWVKKTGYDDSYEKFLDYLNMVFAYAGTLSLASECEPVDLEELLPGDMFLKGGSPGHCVLVVDMAVDQAGNKCYLLAQGYMPAQDFHIIKNPLHPEDPWYYSSELNYPLSTPDWQFQEGSAVRWRDFPLTESLSSASAPEEQSTPAWSEAGVSPEASASRLTLLAVGDNLIHIEVVRSGKQADSSYNYDHLYSRLKEEITAADLAVVNQETILGGEDFPYSGYPNFNSPTQIGDALVDAGFDIVLHATNHTMDMGLKGVENTLAYWKTYPGITVLGINETEEASRQIPIIEKNGIKLALLNYTYSLNGYSLPKKKPYLVNILDKKKMAEDLALAEAQADFTIVFPHWGSEYVYTPTSMQKELTKFYYEHGVDLVIGAHPHVIEPVEWIESDGEHRMLVYYSLGNFMSYQKEAPRMLGAMAKVTITKDGSGTYISEAGITPLVTHYENGPADFHYGIYKLADYTPQLARIHGVSDIAKNGEMDYQTTLDLAKGVLGSWYR